MAGKTSYYFPDENSIQAVSRTLRQALGLDSSAPFKTNADLAVVH
ncbi:hypothetical protein [Peribacillus kribbensis]|nr:hypothetical protein [Peribacillus kribbensis]